MVFAGEALLDLGASHSGRAVATEVAQALVQTVQSAACHIRVRRAAGDLLGRLGWTPDVQEGDVLLAPADQEPTGLDAFRRIPGQEVWMGKYPVTNRQFARFVEAEGYAQRVYGSDEGWAWVIHNTSEKRDKPNLWHERKWNSPLFPVVGITWFEAEAYTRWLTAQLASACHGHEPSGLWERLQGRRSFVRLPTEAEWEAAMGGCGDYPWEEKFAATHLNCADAWAGQRLADHDVWSKLLRGDSDERRDAGTTAVSTYPQGVSPAGLWDGSGNVWEWVFDSKSSLEVQKGRRGGAWAYVAATARVSSRTRLPPTDWFDLVGFRLVVAPVLS